jgi:predicted peptidase
MKFFIAISFYLSLLGTGAFAQEYSDPTDAYFTSRSESFAGYSIPYSIYTPPGLKDLRGLPIILALHGSGEAGSDGILNTQKGIGPALRKFPERYQAIVVLPQLPAGKKWDSHLIEDNLESPTIESLAMEILTQVIAEYDSDRTRVYLTGNSLGGFATWDLASQFPDFFAAAASISGGGNPAVMAPKLTSLPLYVAHGRLDLDVKFKFSKEMVAAVLDAGNPNLVFKAFRFHFHNVWDNTYADENFTDWLFDQHR